MMNSPTAHLTCPRGAWPANWISLLWLR